MVQEISVLSNCLSVSLEEWVVDNVYTALIMAEKDILEFVQISKNTIDADSCDENKMNTTASCSRIIRNEEHHEKYAQLFRRTFNGEINNKMDDIE
ncbi:hypothetical protein TNCV_168511 [Trichonephila clavipes]|nr:hypothetical protein TNCV_168511 [Trichonephila clavipes]